MYDYTPLDQKLMKSKKEKKLLPMLVGTELLFHVVIVVILLLLFVQLYPLGRQVQDLKAANNQPVSISIVPAGIIADSKSGVQGVYINRETLDLNKELNKNIHLTSSGPLKREVFGYIPYWFVGRLQDLNISTVTSLSYFGLEVDGKGNFTKLDKKGVIEAWDTWQNSDDLKKFIVKAKRNRVKFGLTIKAFNNTSIERLVMSDAAQATCIKNILYQVNSRNLDSINIDFEYVGVPSNKVRDRFSIFITNLYKELKKQDSRTELSIATYVTAASIQQLWDLEYLTHHSDAFVIMGYDFTTPRSANAGPVAPMGGYGDSLVGLLDHYLEKISPEKLILAVPYYGYDWPTEGSSKNAKVVDSGEVKVLTYAASKDLVKESGVQWDTDTQTPWYTYTDGNGQRRVLHYENVRSLGIKYDFINTKNLKGVGIWAMGYDGNDPELLQLLLDKFTY